MTAFFHSLTNKKARQGQDQRMRFSVTPAPGESGFAQWHDAMLMVSRLPGGVPQEFRQRLWLTLGERHLIARGVNWSQVERQCFNEWYNPDDDELGDQIVKDLHRTGCSLFCGEDAEANQAMLKRVLLAYARWNKNVGYCQGFNMLAAIILEVMERREEQALKVMIYLIEGVLPESYFANSLRGLSVDMAVFRELLRQRLPALSRHLDMLQHESGDPGTMNYEPPLTNVFTMQWFLTLFSNCLPRETVMRVWDLIFLHGNEVLLRTALALWAALADRIVEVRSADEFYTVMGVLTREMLAFGTMEPNRLVQTIVTMAPFPFPGLSELRDKYRYNITPWTLGASVSTVARKGLRLFYADEEGEDEDDDHKLVVAAAFGVSGIFRKSEYNVGISGKFRKTSSETSRGSSSSSTTSSASGQGGFIPRNMLIGGGSGGGGGHLDISSLRKQYDRLRERQKQAHIVLTASQIRAGVGATIQTGARRAGGGGGGPGGGGGVAGQQDDPGGRPKSQRSASLTMNHLLMGKKALTSKTKRVVTQGMIPTVKKKAERKLSDSTGTRSNTFNQQQQQKQQQTAPLTQTPARARGIPESGKGTEAGRPAGVAAAAVGGGASRTTTPPRLVAPRLPPRVETLHWKDARKDRRSSLPCGVKLLEPITQGDQGPEEGKEDESDSTSTELCDEDDEDEVEEDKVSELEDDLDEKTPTKKKKKKSKNDVGVEEGENEGKARKKVIEPLKAKEKRGKEEQEREKGKEEEEEEEEDRGLVIARPSSHSPKLESVAESRIENDLARVGGEGLEVREASEEGEAEEETKKEEKEQVEAEEEEEEEDERTKESLVERREKEEMEVEERKEQEMKEEKMETVIEDRGKVCIEIIGASVTPAPPPASPPSASAAPDAVGDSLAPLPSVSSDSASASSITQSKSPPPPPAPSSGTPPPSPPPMKSSSSTSPAPVATSSLSVSPPLTSLSPPIAEINDFLSRSLLSCSQESFPEIPFARSAAHLLQEQEEDIASSSPTASSSAETSPEHRPRTSSPSPGADWSSPKDTTKEQEDDALALPSPPPEARKPTGPPSSQSPSVSPEPSAANASPPPVDAAELLLEPYEDLGRGGREEEE
ncbi:uncharacterized protein LOC143034396 isoform X3 [Oratosquilla oratoria]|uniref:uncharacterized protein LOC143034396 isoform X3 n=1 Tax=Oratosquilla oratoria TaxID=337810 RepID=UPI003F75FA65